MSDRPISSLSTLQTEPSFVASAAPSAPPAEGRFGEVMRQVRQGDTLIGLVKRHYAAAGQTVSEQQAYRLAHQLARDNGIRNADLILPGQTVALDRLPVQASAASWAQTQQAAQARPVVAHTAAAVAAAPRQPLHSYRADGNHPVLERTLQRAVQKGFVPPHEAQAVHRRVLEMADKYGFSPDDFAKVSLMESDGMNPKASNGSCHGIIQFCGGSGRGADSVGFGRNARDILGLGVLQQLDLVDRYLADVGLYARKTPLKLDDLYLSVLMPSARRETRADVPLDIAGQQAAKLYVGGNRAGHITRQSIVQGLVQHAMARLGGDTSAPAKVARSAEPPVQAP